MTELCAADPPILDLLHLQAGAVVGVAVEKGRMVIEPQRSGYTLDELLAQGDAAVEASAEDRARRTIAVPLTGAGTTTAGLRWCNEKEIF